MKPSSSASAAAVNLEDGVVVCSSSSSSSTQPDDGPPKVSTSFLRSRRLVLLVAALLLVALVNTARMVGVQEYLQMRQSISSDEDLALLPPRQPDCVKLEKSHIDPGFYRADTCLSRVQLLSIIKELVFTGANAFDAHNVTYFLDSGTLLGAFRDQKVIVHDTDADFGIDTAGLNYLQHHAIDFPDEYHFTVWNSSLYPRSDRDDKLPARLIHKATGLYLDVFAFLDWTDAKTGQAKVGPLPSWCFYNCASCPKVKSGGKSLQVARDWIFPVVDCTFEGRETFKCPHKTQQYLRYAFGKNYMTPVKYTHR